MSIDQIIVSDPLVMGGVPCFRNTRIPVSTLFENLALGMTIDGIREQWPSLSREDLLAVLEYASHQVQHSAA